MNQPSAEPLAARRRPFHVLVKPVGPRCNLRCRYCFYTEKEVLFDAAEADEAAPPRSLPDDLLEMFIREYLETSDLPEVNFAWQGGEPTLAGLEFFRRAVKLQKRYAQGRTVSNALQTNGTLLDDEWCAFLAEEKFLVGLSLDGPREIHDRYRLSRGGAPSFDRVWAALQRLRKHGVDFNAMVSVSRESCRAPLEIYRFLRDEAGAAFHQYIPLVEREPDARARGRGLALSGPPAPDDAESPPVTPFSVPPKEYGAFLIAIFDEWLRHDVAAVFVNLFENALATWMGLPAALCVSQPECGNALVLEHDGSIYACDHYVYPEFLRGNLRDRSLNELARSPEQLAFGRSKALSLPRVCRQCEFLRGCHGECPKHRFLRGPGGEGGLNYLCESFKRFYRHAGPYLSVLADLLRSGQPPQSIMARVARQDAAKRN